MRNSSLVACAIAMLALAACAAAPTRPPAPAQTEPAAPAQPAPPAAKPASSAAATESTAPIAPVPLSALKLTLTPVARGFESPLWVTGCGDGSGRLFVAEQTGRVRVIRDGTVQPGPFLDVSRRITSGGERGLLGLAFAPDYSASGVFYVNYTDLNGDTVIARYTANDPASDTPKLTGPVTILKVRQPYANHNGGCIIFERGTKKMWVGMGDGGSAGDPGNRAQNSKALLGKMLILDFAKGAKPTPVIADKGVRNPWRFSFDRKTRDLWIGDVGQNLWEEITFLPYGKRSGRNLGWDRWEGNHAYPPGSQRSRTGYVFPIAEHKQPDAASITGGYVYRGTEYPTMVGSYIYGDFVGGWVGGIRRTNPNGSLRAKPEKRRLLTGVGTVASFGEDDDGELYLVDYAGTVLQVGAK